MTSQLKIVNKGFTPYFTATTDCTDIRIWYVRIAGLDAPYKNGEYLFCLVAPDEFPQKPPSLKFLTDNGLFVPGHKVCISVGEFHANDKPGKDGAHGWRPSLGMHGFSREVVNALICHADLGGGIGIAHKSPAEKQYLASISRKFNENHYPEIVADLDAFAESHRSLPAIKSLFEGRGESADVAPAQVPADAAPAAQVSADAAPAAQAPAAQVSADAAPAAQAGAAGVAAMLSADDELDAVLAEMERM